MKKEEEEKEGKETRSDPVGLALKGDEGRQQDEDGDDAELGAGAEEQVEPEAAAVVDRRRRAHLAGAARVVVV